MGARRYGVKRMMGMEQGRNRQRNEVETKKSEEEDGHVNEDRGGGGGRGRRRCAVVWFDSSTACGGGWVRWGKEGAVWCSLTCL